MFWYCSNPWYTNWLRRNTSQSKIRNYKRIYSIRRSVLFLLGCIGLWTDTYWCSYTTWREMANDLLWKFVCTWSWFTCHSFLFFFTDYRTGKYKYDAFYLIMFVYLRNGLSNCFNTDTILYLETSPVWNV